MNGTIKKIVDGKPFGFITPSEGGDDVFFHESSLQGVSLGELREGTEVTFEVEQADKGPRATSVSLAGGGGSAAAAAGDDDDGDAA